MESENLKFVVGCYYKATGGHETWKIIDVEDEVAVGKRVGGGSKDIVMFDLKTGDCLLPKSKIKLVDNLFFEGAFCEFPRDCRIDGDQKFSDATEGEKVLLMYRKDSGKNMDVWKIKDKDEEVYELTEQQLFENSFIRNESWRDNKDNPISGIGIGSILKDMDGNISTILGYNKPENMYLVMGSDGSGYDWFTPNEILKEIGFKSVGQLKIEWENENGNN